MVTVARTEKMFVRTADDKAKRAGFDSLYRLLSRWLLPAWVIQYGEEKAEEIKRNQFFYV